MTRYLTDQEIAFNIQDPVARQTAMLNRDIAMRTPPDIQSIAERVCKVLALRLSESVTDWIEILRTGGLEGTKIRRICQGTDYARAFITSPRDWAAILSEKEEK